MIAPVIGADAAELRGGERRMTPRIMAPARFRGLAVDRGAIEKGVHLAERGQRVGAKVGQRADVPERHGRFQRIGVDVEDLGARLPAG